MIKQNNRTALLLSSLSLILSIVMIAKSFMKQDIVYIDSNKILAEYKVAIAVQQEFEGKEKEWQRNIDTLQQELTHAFQHYEKSMVVGAAKDQQLAKKEVEHKKTNLERYMRATQENSESEKAKLINPVYQKVNQFLTGYGKKKGYKLILIANPVGTISYAEENLNITDEVIAELNKAHGN